ncbi:MULTISPECIES: hypothetical protein [unclassified Microcoleus]|uniref:hypothetical protein n=1 Tax=unclassified Microcoleus TaxID=2642155 RepID=UPI002FD18A44
MSNAQQELALPTQILSILPAFLTALAATAILVVGGLRVMNGGLSIGMLIAYQSLTQQFLQPVNNLVNFGSTLQELEADLNRLDDVLQNPIDPEADRDAFNNGNSRVALAPDAFHLQGSIELLPCQFWLQPLGSATN